MSHCKNIQAGKSYGNVSAYIKEFAKNTEIKKSDGNNVIAKSKVLESLTTLIISVEISK